MAGRRAWLPEHDPGRTGRSHGAHILLLLRNLPAKRGVQATAAELAMLLAERAPFAAAMHAEVPAAALIELKPAAHLAAPQERVDARDADRAEEAVDGCLHAARAVALVHNLRDLPERDARAPARLAAQVAVAAAPAHLRCPLALLRPHHGRRHAHLRLHVPRQRLRERHRRRVHRMPYHGLRIPDARPLLVYPHLDRSPSLPPLTTRSGALQTPRYNLRRNTNSGPNPPSWNQESQELRQDRPPDLDDAATLDAFCREKEPAPVDRPPSLTARDFKLRRARVGFFSRPVSFSAKMQRSWSSVSSARDAKRRRSVRRAQPRHGLISCEGVD